MQQNLNTNIKLTDKSEAIFFGKPEKYDYSKFSSIDEFGWDDELMNKLTPLAEKLNLSQESVELLMELALEMSQKQKAQYEKDEEQKQVENILNYNKLFSEDNELPKVNSIQIRKFMELANGAYSDFATPKLKEILEKTGLVYHPEMIKMFHKIGVLSQEDNLSHCGTPSIEELTPAQILYGTSN
ncbi:MAG: hypothetical protein IKU37_02380 [Candidatus Gastranaerophilales bacterium]|nr:hypothetical protein [Candidatus Gastranaerophilales bacterium]